MVNVLLQNIYVCTDICTLCTLFLAKNLPLFNKYCIFVFRLILQFSLSLCSLEADCVCLWFLLNLSCLGFIEILGPVACSISSGDTRGPYLFKYFFCLFSVSSLSRTPSVLTRSFDSVPKVSDVLFGFSSLVPLCFQLV